MSQQTPLEAYFKNKSNVRTMESIQNTRKRRNLSLSTKNVLNNSTPNVKVNKVIDLCSDSDNSPIEMEPSLNISQTSNSSLNSSQSTIIYSFTPKKTPNTSAGSFSGSSSSKKFFSPTKKRIVTKKSPVKRNLATSFGEPSLNVIENDVFTTACEGMDDKTIFLLTIINKYLKDDSLRSLLDEPAEQLLSKCLDIVKPGARLVCRLYWYQPGWYRKDKIIQIFNNKKETIDDPSFQIIMNCLLDKGLIECSNDNSNISFEDFTKLLNFDEIRTVCKDLKIKIQTKQSAVEALRKFSRSKPISTFFNGGAASNDARLLDIMKSKVGICFKLSDAARDALYKLHLLMYLGINYETIREKKLELMLINDKINRETYPVDKGMKVDSAAVVFKTRDEFLRYMDAHIMYENYLSETDVLTKCGLVTKVYNLYKDISDQEMIRYKSFPIWLHRFTPPYIYVKILESGIQELKKIKCKDHYQVALDILSTLIEQVAFRQHKKGEWYAEKALILHKLVSRYDEAANILLQGLKSNLREEYKATMKLRAIKLGRQLNIQLEDCLRSELIKHGGEQLVLEKEFTSDHVNKQHMDSDNKRGKKKFQVRSQDDIQYLEAEDYCIIHYLNNGAWTHGEHWEGRIITTLFFLLFWDIIYTKPRGVNGVFLSHYQMFPLDLYTESFYINRKTLIDERLASIEAMETDEMLRIIKEKWEERPEHELSAINRSIDYNNLSSVAGAAGGRRLAALCGRLAAHYGYAHSGFPDLTLWNVHTNKIKFVEVKTDTDKPSIKQLQWMQYLKEHGIDTGFCYVGVNTTRSKARGSASMIQFKSSPSD